MRLKKQNVSIVRPEDYDLEAERAAVIKFMQENGLEVDAEFIRQITLGDIVEVYSVPENTQIYRNTEFIKHCSYTTEQMATIPFPKLFWRSEDDHVTLMHRASQVVSTEKKCVPWDVGNHQLVESLHPKKRTFEIQMGVIAPCFELKTQARRAWASTLKVSFIFEWGDDLT